MIESFANFAAVDFFKKRFETFGFNKGSGSDSSNHCPIDIQVVLGSGLGDPVLNLSNGKSNLPSGWRHVGDISFKEVPGFPSTSVIGHAGVYRYFSNGKKNICFQVGRLHGYEGHSPKMVIQTVVSPCLAGTRKFVLTNAAGSLTRDFLPGSMMIINDHVNMTGQNPLMGPNPHFDQNEGWGTMKGKEIGPRFPDLTQTYDKELRGTLRTAFQKADLKVFEGTYCGLTGPSFETPAEVALFARMGLQAVGMSTVWEAIALKYLAPLTGVRLVGASLISNLGVGLGGEEPLDHLQVLEQSKESAEKVAKGFFNFFETTL